MPPTVVDALGAGKRPPVRVTLNGYTYRSTIAVMGGKFTVGVSAEVRAAAGVAGGDTLDVDIALDSAPRTVTVPPDLEKALKRDAKARARFAALCTASKRRWLYRLNRPRPTTRGSAGSRAPSRRSAPHRIVRNAQVGFRKQRACSSATNLISEL